LTTKEAGKPKRPHQAFLLLQDQDTGLESTFPLSIKETGKGKVELVRCASPPHQCQTHEKQSQKDLPVQFLYSSQPLQATLLLASFGSSQPFSNHVFNLDVKFDANTPKPNYEKPLRYGKLPEIHHIFKTDPKSGPIVISVFFVGAVLAAVPILLGTVSIPRTYNTYMRQANSSFQWAYLGANLDHTQKALSAAPISHALFFGSIVSMEGIFFLYYCSWTLFQMLPVAGIVGLVAFVSGSKALSEVQARRMAGER
jgi:oligosaccharyltransferase complex subunit delta (ribophorin II)